MPINKKTVIDIIKCSNTKPRCTDIRITSNHTLYIFYNESLYELVPSPSVVIFLAFPFTNELRQYAVSFFNQQI